MKATVIRGFGEPEVMKLEEVADPTPGPGQVLISTRAIGVNPVDTYIRAGKYGTRQFPFIPGFDAAGVVEAIGPGVTNCRTGDRVYTSAASAYAQKIVVEQSRAYPMPERITFVEAACVGVPAATAYRALFQRGEAQAAQVVLIHGATGGVGTAALQLARAAGLTVIGTGGTEDGRKLIQRLGCHVIVDHHKSGYEKQIIDATGGRGVDLILEMLANMNLAKDLEMLAPNGKVVVIGSRDKIEIDPRLTMGKETDIRGMTLSRATPEQLRSIHAALYAAMETGIYCPVIAREMPLAEAPAAHRAILEPHAPGNLVLMP